VNPGEHWLDRPENVRRVWRGFLAVLALLVVVDLVFTKHEDFGIADTFAFYAWFGFAACVALIVVSKVLGIILKRDDTYYDRQ
jgi:hypothetical protein